MHLLSTMQSYFQRSQGPPTIDIKWLVISLDFDLERGVVYGPLFGGHGEAKGGRPHKG